MVSDRFPLINNLQQFNETFCLTVEMYIEVFDTQSKERSSSLARIEKKTEFSKILNSIKKT